MNSSTPIRLVCFDLGGVLIRICRDWKQACERAGLELRGSWTNGRPDAPDWSDLSLKFSTGCIDGHAWCNGISELLRGLYSPQEIQQMHRAWLLGEYEGVGHVIDRIHSSGLETASLSNTDADHWQQIVQFPSVAKLRYRQASHLLGHYKPDPEIYRAFESRVPYRAGEILFFDDLPQNIAAALEAGWQAVQIDAAGGTDQQIEDALRRFGIL